MSEIGVLPRASKYTRAFHFFSMEVKGWQADLGNQVAFYQNLNTASQALHNLYVFMKEAGDEKNFFEKVRFYSAVATTAGFAVRVHRAFELGMNKGRIHPDYPLAFAYDEIFNTHGGDYKKDEVLNVVKNIFFEYGVNTLLPILEKAVNSVLAKVKEPKRPADGPLDSSFTRKRFDNMGLGNANPPDSQGSTVEDDNT